VDGGVGWSGVSVIFLEWETEWGGVRIGRAF
jgi:hypothetical protein